MRDVGERRRRVWVHGGSVLESCRNGIAKNLPPPPPPTHTQMSVYVTGEIWTSCMFCANVNFLVLIMYYSDTRCQHWGRPEEGIPLHWIPPHTFLRTRESIVNSKQKNFKIFKKTKSLNTSLKKTDQWQLSKEKCRTSLVIRQRHTNTTKRVYDIPIKMAKI